MAIPFTAKPFWNTSEFACPTVAAAHDVVYEGLPTGNMAVRKRPGQQLFCRLAGQGQGIYWSTRLNRLIAVAGGNVYSISQEGTATVIGSGLNGTNSVTFAAGQTLALDPFLYIADGGPLHYTDGVTVTQITDPMAPNCSFIAMLNNRFFANDVDHPQWFWITGVNPVTKASDPFYWSDARNPFVAAMRPDILSALVTGWNEIYLCGRESIEVWQDDGVNPISPIVGAQMEIGVYAPQSIVVADDTFYMLAVLNGKRAVIKIENRAPKVISEDIANLLQNIPIATDAVAHLQFTGGCNQYVLSFPQEGLTLAYDIKLGTWVKWGYWNEAQGQYGAYRGHYAAYSGAWNKTFVLDKDTGGIYTVDRELYTDDGNTIRSAVRTGWLNNGTNKQKRCDNLYIDMQNTANVSPTAYLRWRDDYGTEWTPAMELKRYPPFTDSIHRPSRLGIYRQRQYELIMPQDSDICLVAAEEDVKVMRI